MVKVDGAALLGDLRNLEATIQQASEKALADAVKAALDDAKATALYADRTGNLRRSTTSSVSGLEGQVEADAEYAAYVEASGRPFMEHASDVGTQALEVFLGKYADDAIDRFNR